MIRLSDTVSVAGSLRGETTAIRVAAWLREVCDG